MDKLEFARKYVYPKLSKAEFDQVVELSEQYGLDITKGGYAAFSGKLYLTVYGMLQIALQSGFAGNELGDAPEITVQADGQAYTVPEFNTVRVRRFNNIVNTFLTSAERFEASYEATVYFSDYAHTKDHCRYAHMFMEKWALAMALRRGFADKIGNQVSFEEVAAGMQFSNKPVSILQVDKTTDNQTVQIDAADPAIAEAIAEVTSSKLNKELTELATAGVSNLAEVRSNADKAIAELFG